MELNQAAVNLLKQSEGLRLKPYDDDTGRTVTSAAQCSGKPTIGWGHVILAGEDYLWAGITEAQAEHLLQQDLQQAERTVKALVHAKLNANQYGALVVFQFNTGGLAGSNVQRMLNAGDFTAAMTWLMKWNKVRNPKTKELEKSDGLVARRTAERTLFNTEV